MIIRYREESEVVTIHSHAHKVCTHELEDGWECDCSACQCGTVINVNARYAYDDDRDHKVIIELNPGFYRNSTGALTPDGARALAAALCFAANDADTLNKEFPND